jgi:transposase InsO family protein
MVKKPKAGGRTKRRKKSTRPFSLEFKLKVVRLFLEEGYSRPLIAQEFNISESSVGRWAGLYKKYGEKGLQPKSRAATRNGVSADVREKIIDLKRSNPSYGNRRISDVLKRFFLVRTSPSTVHKTLSKEGLVAKAKPKPKKNPSKPRFFERATPNQLWQTDIMTFRLAGRNAYLIGYLDDYSRYITACGFYRSQTAEHVIETYRRAISEYGVPREMLTDNGRQYTNWRGTTRFERELKKDRVKHIKSRPHHPMTLGKIERFWKSIQAEFLQRAQFGSFEEAVERCSFWIKYYNYKRPHQGIGGLCPADRFFEIQHALKKTLEKGIEENTLELALRGKPRDPFYMVGRLGDQSVVIRAEKGKVRMLVDGEEAAREKELVYDARKDIDHEDSQKSSEKIVQRPAEDHRRTVGMDRASDDVTDVRGDGDKFESIKPMAEPSHGGDAGGVEPEKAQGTGSIELTAETADRKEPCGPDREVAETVEGHREGQGVLVVAESSHETSHFPQEPAAGRGDHEGSLRADDSLSGGGRTGSVAQDVLQMGAAWPCRPFGWPLRPEGRQAREAGARVGPGEAACRQPAAKRVVAEADGTKGSCPPDQSGVGVGPDEKKMSGSCRP